MGGGCSFSRRSRVSGGLSCGGSSGGSMWGSRVNVNGGLSCSDGSGDSDSGDSSSGGEW